LDEEARIIGELSRADAGTDPFAAAVRATRMPMLITDPQQPDNPIVFANAAFARLTGFERHEIVGRNCRFLQGPETNGEEVARLRTAIAERRPVELELLNYRKDGSRFWNRLLVSPVFDQDGALTYFFASQFDVTLERERLARLEQARTTLEGEIEKRNADLQASEQRLRFALKAGRLGSWNLDLGSGRLIVSDGFKEIFGLPQSEVVTRELLQRAVHPEDRALREAVVEEAIRTGNDYDTDFRIRTPAGEERWLQVRGQAFLRADGTPLSVVGVAQDITDRKRGEEHRALLANELSHRVKNMLATLQAIIAQTLRRAESLEGAGVTLGARIQAMAAATDLLVNARWETAGIHDLLRRTLDPFGIDDPARFVLGGPEVQLPPRIAVALALGLHELATNAAKYGALSTSGGRVHVQWEVVDGERPQRIRVTWTETGGPPVVPPSRAGFGTRLIERVLAQEVGGTAKIDYRETGVVFTVDAPLPDPAEAVGS
jgi:PAS domain S-box-containing protein